MDQQNPATPQTQTRTALDLRHVTPPSTVYAGDRALTALARALDRDGADSVVVVTSPSLMGAPHQRLVDALGDRRVTTFGRVERYSPTRVVGELRDQLLADRPDAVIVLGGGSSMVTARAGVVMAGENRPPEELYTRRDDAGRTVNPRMPAPKTPIWVVPSTPTPAAAKAGAALRDEGESRRVAIFDPMVRAKGIVIDPTVVCSSPVSLFIATSLNGLSMGVEGLQATASDPFAEALLHQGVRELVTNARALRTREGDWEARARMMMGSAMTGLGSDYSGQGLALALSHEIAPRSSVSGGVVEMILLPGTVRFTAAAVPERTDVVATALGASGSSIDDVEDVLRGLHIALGLPARLRDIGITRAGLEEAVEHAVSDWAMNARMPRRADRSELESIIAAAW